MTIQEIHILPREAWGWVPFELNTPPRSIALDGMVLGGPRYNHFAPRVNFDHHDGVVREATLCTAQQVHLAIKGGLMKRFAPCHVWINDTDQDTALAVWLLQKAHLFEGTAGIPAIHRLLQLDAMLDITGGAYPMRLDDKLLREHNWVFAPYTDLRKTGGIATATPEVMRDNLEAVMARLDRFMMGQGGEDPLDDRATILSQHKTWWLVDEVGGNHARYVLFSKGMDAFVAIVARRPDGRTVYSIGRRSRYIDFPMPELYTALNSAEGSGGRWGGSDIIGGSPRREGSTLTPEEVERVVSNVCSKAA